MEDGQKASDCPAFVELDELFKCHPFTHDFTELGNKLLSEYGPQGICVLADKLKELAMEDYEGALKMCDQMNQEKEQLL